MSHTLIEFYTATSAWQVLDATGREAFFARIAEGMQAFAPGAVTPLAMGPVDRQLPHAAPADYFAVWCCADAAVVRQLVDAITNSGWHDYFSTVNAAGASEDLAAHLRALASA